MKVIKKSFSIDLLDEKPNNNVMLLAHFGQYRSMLTFETR